jgi:hypothetical protein
MVSHRWNSNHLPWIDFVVYGYWVGFSKVADDFGSSSRMLRVKVFATAYFAQPKRKTSKPHIRQMFYGFLCGDE